MTVERRKIERVQTGMRIEKRTLTVLKAIAAEHEISLGDLIEGIVLHSFEGRLPFTGESLKFIEKLRAAYRHDISADESHKLLEK